MKRLMGKLLFAAVLLGGFGASAVTTTDIWKAIGSPSGVTVTSVSGWGVDNSSALGITSWAKSQIAGVSKGTASFTIQFTSNAVLAYSYRVSSESSYDKLVVTLDGNTVLTSSGENSEKDATILLSTSGSHTVVFTYSKDQSSDKGSDAAWIGAVSLKSDKSLVIPASKTSIAAGEYKNSSYTRITFEEGSLLTSVGANAFQGSGNLKSIEFPEGLLTIDDGAFDGCTSLTNVVFPTTLTSLGKIDVASLTALADVFGDGYWILSDWVIGYQGVCPPEIVDVDHVRGLAKEALKDNPYLETFAPSTSVLTGIPESAFKNCFALQYVTLPQSLKSIGESAFCGCTLLDWIDIPGSCETIGSAAFKYCFSLEGVTFASGVKSIGGNAFYDDYMLEEVDLPATVVSVGSYAFGGDSSLIRIGLPETVNAYSSSTKQKLSDICSNFAHIREVTIKDAGGELVNGLFDGCKELNAVRFLSTEAPTVADHGTTLFKDTPETLTVYVPYGSTGWGGLAGAKGLPQAWPRDGSCPIRRSIAYWDVPTYLVEFDSNGGTLGVQPTYQKPETAFDLPPEPRQSGYTFAGWWTSPVEGWQVTADTIFIEGVYTTLYAHWTRAHTIFLDANGGTVTKTAIQVEQSVYGVLPAPVRTGYAFGGWSYQGETIVPNMNILTNADHTLTAQWTAFNYSVHFNANGGTGTMQAQEFKYDTLQSLSKCTFTRAGYCFAGWATTAKGTAVYPDCKMVKNLSSLQGGVVSLFAVWAPAYTVVFHKYDGTTTSATRQFGYGVSSRLTKLSELRWGRGGMTFRGWATSEANARAGTIWKTDGGIVASPTAAGTTMHAYAVWAPKAGYYIVRFNRQDGNGTWRTGAYRYGVLTTLPSLANGLSWARKGYAFRGWALSVADASAGKIWKGDRPQIATGIPAGTVRELYAVWRNDNAYNIVFHKYDGTTTTVQYDFELGVLTRLPSLSVLGWNRGGMTFKGWASGASNAAKGTVWKTDKGLVSSPCSKGGVIHAYAVWVPASGYYVVRFNKNDGTGAWRTAAYKYGVSSTLASCGGALGWSRAGYAFTGWALTTAKAAAGEVWKVDRGVVVSPFAAGTTKDIYAIWKKTSASVAAAPQAAAVDAAAPTVVGKTPSLSGRYVCGEVVEPVGGIFNLLVDEDGATGYVRLVLDDEILSGECEILGIDATRIFIAFDGTCYTLVACGL